MTHGRAVRGPWPRGGARMAMGDGGLRAAPAGAADRGSPDHGRIPMSRDSYAVSVHLRAAAPARLSRSSRLLVVVLRGAAAAHQCAAKHYEQLNVSTRQIFIRNTTRTSKLSRLDFRCDDTHHIHERHSRFGDGFVECPHLNGLAVVDGPLHLDDHLTCDGIDGAPRAHQWLIFAGAAWPSMPLAAEVLRVMLFDH